MIFALVLTVGLAAGVQAQTRSITNQLVVHLTFDDTMNDNSGRGNNATYNSANGLVINPPAPTYRGGKIGGAFEFTTAADGSKIDFASLGYPDDLKFGANVDWSVAFWIYNTNSLRDPAFVCNKNWYASANQGWGVFADDSGGFRVQGHATDGSGFSYTTASSVSDGAWHHIVVSHKRGAPGSMKIFRDGALLTTISDGNTGTGSLDTDGLLNGLGNAMAMNVGEDGTGGYNNSVNDPPPVTAAGDTGIYNAAIDDVGFWRRALTEIEVAAVYNFGQLGTNLYYVPDVKTPIVISFTPATGAVGVPPYIPVTARIQDQDTKVNTNSLLLLVDGVSVPFTLDQVAATNTLTYTQPFMAAPLSVHTNILIFADNGTPTPSRSTNVSFYTVVLWSNVYLPPPIYLETFDEVVPSTNPPANYPTDIAGNCPAGWTVTNCTSLVGFWDPITQVTSDLYANFAIVPVEIIRTFNFGTRIDMVGSPLVVNGALVTTSLASSNVVFAASDGRANGPQYDRMFTCDYDLTGKSNIWVGYNNILTTERGMFSSLEYSINQGASWLPVAYYICSNAQCVVITDGVFDPVATITNTYWPTPRIQPDNCSADPENCCYAKFIGVDSSWWASLGPYIHLGGRGDNSSYHRVEKYRLPQADGQAAVRFRFAFSGRDYWDWGFDNFGIYSIPSPPDLQLSVVPSGTNIRVTWNGTDANFSGLQKATSLSTPNWVDIPGTIGQTSYTAPASGTATFYRAKKF